ncbi:MAG: Holliday junction resolvase RuvX [Candidatus Niyogibacteria bacterium]|nr:Holliday junction resolvase RuvX [Candidatus Niyogibacteria bacterium]
MPRVLGVDYGTKKIGIAVSDEGQKIAFPRTVLPNEWVSVRDFLFQQVAEGVSEIVLGLPVGLDGKETKLSGEVRRFAQKLGKEFGLPVHFENEVYSSAAVKTASGFRLAEAGYSHAKAGEARPKNIDAASAAVILQSFLDRRKRPEGNP